MPGDHPALVPSFPSTLQRAAGALRRLGALGRRPHAAGDVRVASALDHERGNRLLGLALTLVSVVASADVLLGTSIVLIGLYSFAPLVAASRLGPRRTAAVAGYSLLLAVISGYAHGIFGTPDFGVRSLTVALAGVVSVWSAILRSRLEATRSMLEQVVRQMPLA